MHKSNSSSQPLVIRNLRRQPSADILLGLLVCPDLWRWNHIGSRYLGRLFPVVDTHNRHIIDRWMADKQAFELRGRDLEALPFDEFFDPVGDVEVAVGVLVTNVAGSEIAVLGDGVAGSFFIVEVALKDVGTLDPELAHLAYGQLSLIRGHVFGELVREEFAYGADGSVPVFPRLCVGRRARLAESITLLDGTFDVPMHGRDEFSSQWCSTGVQHPQRTKVVLFNDGMFAEEEYDRRHDIGECDAEILNDGAKPFKVEPRQDHQC